jgi:hypothetical protein
MKSFAHNTPVFLQATDKKSANAPDGVFFLLRSESVVNFIFSQRLADKSFAFNSDIFFLAPDNLLSGQNTSKLVSAATAVKFEFSNVGPLRILPHLSGNFEISLIEDVFQQMQISNLGLRALSVLGIENQYNFVFSVPNDCFDILDRIYSNKLPLDVFFFFNNPRSIELVNMYLGFRCFFLNQEEGKIVCFDSFDQFCFVLTVSEFPSLISSAPQLEIKLEKYNNKYYFT